MKVDFSKRSNAVEIMDDLHCHGEVVHQTLRELDFINQWLGGNRVTLDALNKFLAQGKRNTLLHIGDLGCGGGEMLKRLAILGRKRGIPMKLTGFDANPHIVEFARNRNKDFPEISFEVIDVLSPEFQVRDFDVLIATLFCHHFTDKQLTTLIARLHHQARLAVIINDLHRHWLAYHSIRILTGWFSKSSMVKYDAPLSVLRAFRKSDWVRILSATGVGYQMLWKWAFRWQVVIPGAKSRG